MVKNKVKKTKKAKLTISNAKGIIYKDILWYYDTHNDFLEAWPGFKLWIAVEEASKVR